MKKYIKQFARKIRNFLIYPIDEKLNKSLMLQGYLQAKQNLTLLQQEVFLDQVEFSVFSQNGEDGIIDFLIELLEIEQNPNYQNAFVEFGVQNYTESNTRFLLQKRNWFGCVIDGSKENINYIKHDNIYWKHDLEAICSFITKDNIDKIISDWLISRGLKNIALLSIDIDGVDYYVWENISCISPAIVVVEFNALFGSEAKITVPYRDDFIRGKAHYSHLFFGASMQALIHLGRLKGYHFVGGDKSGTNLFFVKECLLDKCKNIKTRSPQEYCNYHLARQSRSRGGGLNFLHTHQRLQEIADCQVVCIGEDYGVQNLQKLGKLGIYNDNP